MAEQKRAHLNRVKSRHKLFITAYELYLIFYLYICFLLLKINKMNIFLMYCTQYLYWICNQIIIIIDNNFYHDSVTWSHYIIIFFSCFIHIHATHIQLSHYNYSAGFSDDSIRMCLIEIRRTTVIKDRE